MSGQGALAAGGLVLADTLDAPMVQRPLARFRMPLTDRLDPAEAAEIVAELSPVLAPVLARPQAVGDLGLVGDPGRGRPWRLLERFALDGAGGAAELRMPAAMDYRGPRLSASLGEGRAAA